MRNGFLVTFEGGEGCGKSTQIKMLVKYLEENHFDYVLTREPGGTDVGEQIRQIMIGNKNVLSSEAEFFLMSASRTKHVEDLVAPALEAGKIVVMDRFYDSSYTYQGYAGTIALEDIEYVNRMVFKGKDMTPDLTIFLDISYEDGMRRKSLDENLRNLDRFELKGKEYHDKVRYGYLQQAKKEPKRYFVVDATKTREEISNEIIEEFNRRFKNKK